MKPPPNTAPGPGDWSPFVIRSQGLKLVSEIRSRRAVWRYIPRMISGWITSILPGLRESRPVLLAGVAWTLVLALIYPKQLSQLPDGEGSLSVLFRLVDDLPAAAKVVVIGTLIFILGLLATTTVESLARVLGGAAQFVPSALLWQKHAQETVARLESAATKHRSDIETLQAPKADEKEEGRRVARLENAERNLKSVEVSLRNVQRYPILGKWQGSPMRFRRTAQNEKVLGPPNVLPGGGLELAILCDVALRSAEDHLDSAGRLRLMDQFLRQRIEHAVESERLHMSLAQEVQDSGDEVLQAGAEQAYLLLDRARAETRVRIAAAAPTLVAGLALVPVSKWFYLVAVLAGFQLFSSALRLTGERRRVLNTIGVNRLETPSVRNARRIGLIGAAEAIEEDDEELARRLAHVERMKAT